MLPTRRRLRCRSMGALGLLAAITAALLTLPMVASATAPTIERSHTEGPGIFAGPCPNGVTLTAYNIEDVRMTTFYDAQGNPVRLVIKVDDSGTVTNPVTGQTVENPAHETFFIDLVTGTETQVGLDFKATVPGVGVVFHDAGTITFDAEGNVIFEAGPKDVFNTPGEHVIRQNFCKALT
jgi:hypothetical protein